MLICAVCIALMALDNRNEHLQDVRRVLGAAAYPIRVLRFREIVNDEVGGVPILVTW